MADAEKRKGLNAITNAMNKAKELGEKAAENTKAGFAAAAQGAADIGKKVADGAKAGAEAAAQGASEIGKKVADSAKAGAEAAAQGWAEFSKRQEEAAKQRKVRADDIAKQKLLEKYNPLFEADYTADSYTRPNIIMIRDAAERRDIDVCQNAIGWTEKAGELDVLYLYNEYVENSGITFVPAAECDAVYCVDKFDTSKYINAADVFKQYHEDRMAELMNIAYCLGAKHVRIEMSEKNSSAHSLKEKKEAKVTKAGVGGNIHAHADNAAEEQASVTVFRDTRLSGSDECSRPQLKWFAHDANINQLIEMRLSDKNTIQEDTLEIKASTFSTMSSKVAAAIDVALGGKKDGGKVEGSMEQKAKQEHNSTLLFHIEF